MTSQLAFPGTPRSRKRMKFRNLFCVGVATLLCTFTACQFASYKDPGGGFVADGSPRGAEDSRAPEDGGPGPVMETAAHHPVGAEVKSPKQRKRRTTADDSALRQSEFCTNNCNSSEIYERLWYDARVRENSRVFQPSEDADDPYRESIETNLVTKDFRVVIKVLAFNRLESLARCLHSLAVADYGGDSVNIEVFVDHFRYEETVTRRFNATSAAPLRKVVNKNSADDSESPTKVEGGGGGGARRLLFGGPFKRASVHGGSNADAQPRSTNAPDSGDRGFVLSAGHAIVGRLSEVQDSGAESTQNSADMQRGRRGAVNDETDFLDAQLGEAHEILKYLDAFWWSHGTKEIHYRSQNVGLQAQWIESWWPANLDEFAFIVEDDMEVSKLYYRFLRAVVATYYYNPEQYDASVYGISLQRPRFVPGKGGLPLKVKSRKNLFMYPMVGTWGQLLFPKQWKEFRLWYDDHKSKGEKPFLEGMVTNSWYEKRGETIWTPWFVKFAHSRGYFNLYTNFLGERALSISHREPGLNYKKSAAGSDSRLVMKKDFGNDTSLWVMSPSHSLLKYDYCFRPVKKWKRLALTSRDLTPMLASMETNSSSILLVDIIDVPSVLVRNWLCHMEKLGIRKFVLLGDESEFTRDLARRGYATVSAHLFTEAETAVSLLRRDMIAVQAVHGILNLGYNVWLARADAVWLENPLVVTRTNHSDIMASRPLDGFHPALLYLRASQGMLHVWSEWVGSMSVVARRNNNTIRHSNLWHGLESFVTSKTNCRYLALPSSLSGSVLDLKTVTGARKRAVFLFNGVHGRIVPLVVRRLKAAGLWAIDKDLACKRVYC